MHTITTKGITEGKATNAIINACRANSARESKDNVTFKLTAKGEHEATLRNAAGIVVAIAIVDEFDC